MKKLLALLVVALSSVTLHAQGVWIEENIDPDTGLKRGVIEVNGDTYTIAPFTNLRRANLAGADLSQANLRGARIQFANLSGANLSGAMLIDADFTGSRLVGANLNETRLDGANLGAGRPLDAVDLTGASFIGAVINNTNLQFSIWNTPDPRIAELEAQLAAVTAERDARPTIGQLLQLNAILDNRQASIEERDQQIAELSQRPTIEEVQDARAGSLVFRADKETNAVTLEFEIQSSENLQDWVAQPETVTATVPLDAEKKFVRITLARE